MTTRSTTRALTRATTRGLTRPYAVAGDSTPLLLDTYPPLAGYSRNKKKSGATAAYRIRRATDNAEQDTPFIGNSEDTAGVASFVGAGDGFMPLWYDQSGNGKNVIQATTTKQPRVALAGVAENPAFDGVNDVLSLGGRLTTGSVTELSISFWLKTTNGEATVIEEYASGGNYQWAVYLYQQKIRFVTNSNGVDASAEVVYNTAVSDGVERHFLITYAAGTVVFYVNSAVVTTSGAATASLHDGGGIFRFGGQQANLYLTGTLRDVYVWQSTLDASAAAAIYADGATP